MRRKRSVRASSQTRDPLSSLLLGLFIVTCSLLPSCGGGSSSTSTAAPTLATITVTAASSSIAAGATDQFSAVAKDSVGDTLSGLTFTWASSATNIATISSSGLATGVAAGTTQITAAANGVTSNAITLTVAPGPVATITVTAASSSVAVGATDQFTAVAKDSVGDTLSGLTFTWASSATNIATINSSGLATGVAVGATQITATAGGVTSSGDTLTVTPAPSSVSGTAAAGSPIVGALVTLKDSAGNSSTDTTAADGTYTLNTTGFTPPFLIQVQATSGNIYSVSADALATTTINTHLFTDLMIRSWYSAQGVSIDTAFANPASVPAPAPGSVGILNSAITNLALLWLNNADVNTSTFNMISSPFAANGAGLDQVLDETTVNTGTGTVIITAGGTTQTSTITYNTTAGTMAVATITTNSNGTSESSNTTVVPTQTAQQTALNGIITTMTAFVNAVNTNGSQLTADEIAPFLAPDLLNSGLNETQYAAELATDLRGSTLSSINIQTVKTLDLVHGTADIVFSLGGAGGLSQISMMPGEFWFENVGGTWLIGGDNRIIQIGLQVMDRTEEGDQSSTGVYISPDVTAPEGTVSSLTVTDASGITGWNAAPMPPVQIDVLTFQPTPTTQLVVDYNEFNVSPGWLYLGATIIPAGTLFTYAITPALGSVVDYPWPSNVYTNEPTSITSPTSGVLSDYTLGEPLTVNWTLPTTFPIADANLNAEAYNGPRGNPSTEDCVILGQSNPPATGMFPTSGTITIPATCGGLAVVSVSLHADIIGANGELTQATVYID